MNSFPTSPAESRKREPQLQVEHMKQAVSGKSKAQGINLRKLQQFWNTFLNEISGNF